MSAATVGVGSNPSKKLPKPKSSHFSFYRDWAGFWWELSVGRFSSSMLPMRGGSVWDVQDGYLACWRFMGAA